ncbi:MAG: acryloyl-CoA reductase [Alphaproteobacteria bacterium]|jgi:acrylyl-CoA reductase (NADPH)|nr:acryloyl-CoA reductase [Alphaproteobacteria bacterium]
MAKGFRALVLHEAEGGGVTAGFETLTDADLPEGDVTVDVAYSDLNYKDGMILNGLGRLVRKYPHVPGVDFAGTVAESAHPAFKPGDAVILTGWRVGESRWGGYAARARVPGDWLVPMPAGLDARRAMAIGTAGFTAALALMKLERFGIAPDPEAPLLVTGAAGGVGSVAVALASRRGFSVTAATGREETHAYLRELGAAALIDRHELSDGTIKPLDKERWGAAIDNVGSTTLAKVLSQMRYRGAVAACGLAAGNDLPATVVPFLLRGVSLLGIDSVLCPMDERKAAWQMIVDHLPGDLIDRISTLVPLGELPALGKEILQGRTRGRVVVDVNA